MTPARSSGAQRRAHSAKSSKTITSPSRRRPTKTPSKEVSSPSKSSQRAGSTSHARNARDLAQETRSFRRARSVTEGKSSEKSVGQVIGRSAIFYDLVGLGLGVVALIVSLGVYFSNAGPLGNDVAKILKDLFGLGRYYVPLYLFLLSGFGFFTGYLTTRGRLSKGHDRNEIDFDEHVADVVLSESTGTSPDQNIPRRQEASFGTRLVRRDWPSPIVFASGLFILGACISGLIDVETRSPGLSDSIQKLAGDGGYIGSALGTSLHDICGTAGASILIVALGLVGVMISSRVSVFEFAGAIRQVVRFFVSNFNHKSYFSNLARDLVKIDNSQPESNYKSHLDNEPTDLSGADLVGSDEGDSQLQSSIEDDFPEFMFSQPDSAIGSEDTDDAKTPGIVGEPSFSEFSDDLDDPRSYSNNPEDLDHEVLDRVPSQIQQLDLGLAPSARVWRLPSLKLLERSPNHKTDDSMASTGARVLREALAAHGVETRVTNYTVGPTVTRYEVEIGPGVKVSQVTNLSKDIAYAMASPDVRILAPIPGRSAIGVEVPNQHRQLVSLGDILSSREALDARHPLQIGLGRDISGKAIMANLAEMPHVLIAGATGAGKSSCINSLVTSLLMRSSPDQVRLILVDPKRVELGQYNGLPHLLTQVVVDPRKAANALAWAVKEMERRYDLLAEVGVRDIAGYNDLVRDQQESIARVAELDDEQGNEDDLTDLEHELDPEFSEAGIDEGGLSNGETLELLEQDEPVSQYEILPFIVIVVDELNDLMMVAARDVEESICRIAQMARAVGIHLVIATQRPSVDVITGVIKANVPSRLAFSVSSLADSRVILDQPGAERLVGKGDMLMLTASSSIAVRVQGPWVSEGEVRKVVGHWKRQGGTSYVEGVEGTSTNGPGQGEGGADDDDLLMSAMELVVRSQLGSTSMLQRKLRVGFARAGRLMDLLERKGIVGPSEGSKARAVLMTPDELNEMLENSGQ